MSATHRIESIEYDPSSLDDFIRALRTLGFIVTQERNTFDLLTNGSVTGSIEFTHFAKWSNAPFNDGLYFKFDGNLIVVRISKQITYTHFHDGYDTRFGKTADTETTHHVYRIPYMLTEDGGIIIRGLGYVENTHTDTPTTYSSGPPISITPSNAIENGWEFRCPDCVVVYQGTELVATLDGGVSNVPAVSANNYSYPGERNIVGPMTSTYHMSRYVFNPWLLNTKKYSLVSHRHFIFASYGDVNIPKGSFGSIYKDDDNNEYYVVGNHAIKI